MSDTNNNAVAVASQAQSRIPLQFEAENFDNLYRMAKALCVSGLIPEALRGKPEDLVVVLLQGRELGLQPMQSINGIDVVKGRAFVKPALMAAKVKQHADCLYLTLVESTDKKATYKTRRRGSDEVILSYTWEMASRANLVGKDNYRANPEAMLLARCLGRICRAEWQDVIGGFYVKGESFSDSGGDDGEFSEIPGGAAAGAVVVEQAPKATTIDGLVAEEKAKKKSKTKTESAGAVAPPAIVTSTPEEPADPHSEVSPASEAAAPAAPSPEPEPAPVIEVPKVDWMTSDDFDIVVSGAKDELGGDFSFFVKSHGGTRGHKDGKLGFAGQPNRSAAFMADLKAAGARRRGDK